MLAAELFLMNKGTGKNLDAKSLDPLKKIFMTKNKTVVDNTTLEAFGSDPTSTRSTFLQDWLRMPLPTTSSDKLNLPDKATGNISADYVVLSGVLTKHSEQKNATITVTKTKGARNSANEIKFSAELDLETKKTKFSANVPAIPLRINKQTCIIGGKDLFREYIDSGILVEYQERGKPINAALPVRVFKNACTEFFKYVKTRDYNKENNKFQTRFRIYLLPNDKTIKAVEEKTQAQHMFRDVTGNLVSGYPSKPTRFAKFVSFDDQAFTPNGSKGQEFYKHIGIGDNTLNKITLPVNRMFTSAGLTWIFIDMNNPDNIFDNHLVNGRGILYQLFKNYELLTTSARGIYKDMAMMKILCMQIETKTKVKILIDENLTMQQIKQIFHNVNGSDIPFYSSEILIHTTKWTTLRNDYLRFVRAILTVPHSFNYNFLIKLLTKEIQKEIFKWVKEKKKDKPEKFFKKAEFCRKLLSDRQGIGIRMNESEKYAYQMGKIARRYIDLRQELEDTNNSFRSILTYPRYDLTKLRFVFERVCQAINFLKTKDKSKINEFIKFVDLNKPEIEGISENDQSNDYSYFFYYGLYDVGAQQ